MALKNKNALKMRFVLLLFALYNMVEHLGFLSISLFMGLYSLHMTYSDDTRPM
jgi:hypothetical protein